MSEDALAELQFKTPSFLCVEQEQWLDHHGVGPSGTTNISDCDRRPRPPFAKAVL
jgi:uncharacterized protein CbrC (UPF0167 family)